MAEKRIYFEVTADTARKNYIERPTLVQNADYGLILHLRHNGGVMDLTDVRDVVLATQPANRRTPSVATLGRVSGDSEVTIDFGRSEVENVGVVNAQVKLLGEDGGTISTTTFEFEVQRDINEGSEPTERDLTLFEIVLGEGPGVIDDARAATQEALDARDRLTEDVRQSLQTLEQDKSAALEELDTRTTAAETQMDERTTAAIEQMETETDDAITGVWDETNRAIEQLDADKAEAIQQMADVREANRTDYLNAVATVQERDTAYPNPRHGDTVRVTEEGRTYRYKDGEGWTVVDENNPTALNEALSKLDDAGAAQTVLSEGTHIVESPTDSPVGVEIRGTTLVSLGNSNLEKGKYYAVTDEKYKVITDGKTVSGVGKFQKGETHKTTADFTGKVTGSTTENPHIMRHQHSATIDPPSSYTAETITHYPSVSTLNGTLAITGNSNNPERGAVQLFSFNIIEQVERTLGIIPGGAVAEKVAWLKSNSDRITVKWHGYGTGPSGNKATLAWWSHADNMWTAEKSHTNSTVELITEPTGVNITKYLGDDGFMHYIAYAEPSDGTTPSTIYTDYVSLDIEIKPTAQLNTRPTIVRVENFEGKVSGSTVENPHSARRRHSDALRPPNYGGWNEFESSRYEAVRSTGGTSADHIHNGAGQISQQIFSFNIIEAVERDIGKIPAIDTAGKVTWLRGNLARLTVNWYGRGSSAGGNRANLSFWYDTGKWSVPGNHASGETARIQTTLISYIQSSVRDDGFIHYIAYAEPSDGTIASSIHTNYVELEIELKPTADFRQPRVPLYEVPKAEYDRIGVSQTDEETKRRYPIVEGVQHLVNPYVVNPGENLLPSIYELKDRMEIYTGASAPAAGVKAEIINDGGTDKLKITNETEFYRLVTFRGFSDLSYSKGYTVSSEGDRLSISTDKYTFYLRMSPKQSSTFWNPMLTLGTEPKPFTPYNPSTLRAPVTLSAVGDKRDVLYQQDGRWYVRRATRTVDLTGDLNPTLEARGDGFHRLRFLEVAPNGLYARSGVSNVIDYKGFSFPYVGASWEVLEHQLWAIQEKLVLSVPDSRTGFNPEMTISPEHSRRYFNGWRYTDGTTWESVTGNGQTATAEEALSIMPTDYTPYKLTYVLANPEVTDVTDIVEGDLIVSELAQITVGSEGQVNVQDAILTIQQSLRSAFDAVNTKLSNNVRDTLMLKRQMLEVLIRLDALEGNLDELEGRTDALEGAVDDLTPDPPVEGGETV